MSRNFEKPKLNTKYRKVAFSPSNTIPGKVQLPPPVLKAVNISNNPGIIISLAKTKKSAAI